MALLDRFRRKRVAGRTPADAPVHPEVITLRSGYSFALVRWNERIAANAALKHPIVYRALDKVCTAFSQIEWRAEVDPKAPAATQRDKVTVIDRLNTMLFSPHDELSRSDLRYWMALNYACYSRVPGLIGMSAMNPDTPNAIYPLDAVHVDAVRNARGIVTEFKYGPVGSEVTYPTKDRAGPGNQFAFQIWKPGLKGIDSNTESPNSPLSAIGLPSQVVKALLLRAIATAEGHPNVRYLVTADATLNEAQKAALRDHLDTSGADDINAGDIPILNNVPGLQIHKLDNDLSDIHSKVPMDDMQRLIFGAFGIPIALAGIGASDAAKFTGNFDSSRASFYEDTIGPSYAVPIFAGLTRTLCPVGVRIAPVYDEIPVMRERRVQSMNNLDGVSFLTTNEKRDMFSLEQTTELPATTGGNETGNAST